MAESELVFKLRADAGDAASGFKEVKTAWDKTAGDLAKPVDVTIDTSKAEAKITNLQKKAGDFEYKPPNLAINTAKAEAKVDALQKDIKTGFEYKPPDIDVKTDKAEAKIKSVAADLVETKQAIEKPVEVKVDTDDLIKTEAEARGVTEQLDQLSRQQEIELDDHAIAKAQQAIRELQEQVRNRVILEADTSDLTSKIGKINTQLRQIQDHRKSVIEIDANVRGAERGLDSVSRKIKKSEGEFGRVARSYKSQFVEASTSVSSLADTAGEFGIEAALALGPVGIGIAAIGAAALGAAVGVGAMVKNATELTASLSAMHDANEITESDLGDLASKGVPATRMLAEGLGMSEDAVRALAKAGKLGREELAVLEAQMDKRYGKGFVESGKELNASFTTIKESASDSFNAIAASALPIINSIMPSLVSAMTGVSDWVTNNGPQIAETFGQIAKGAVTMAQMIDQNFTIVKSAVQLVVGAVSTGAGLVLQAVGKMASALSAISAATGDQAASDQWKTVAGDLDTASSSMKDFGKSQTQAAVDGVKAQQKRHAAMEQTKRDIDAAAQKAKQGAEFRLDVKKTDDAIAATKSKIDDLVKQRATAKTDVDKKEFDTKIAAAKKELKDLEAHKTKLNVEVDTAAAVAKAKILKGEIAGLDKQIDTLSKKKASPQVDIQIQRTKDQITKIEQQLAILSTKKATPEIRAKIDDLQRKKTLAEQTLDALNKKKSTPQVDADLKKLKAKKAEAEKDLKALGQKQPTVKVKADTKDVKSKKNAAEKDLKSLSSKKTEVKLKADSSGVKKAAKDARGSIDSVKQKSTVQIKGDAKSAKSAANDAKAAIKSIPTKKETHISITGLAAYKSAASQAKSAANSIPSSKTTNIRVNRTNTTTNKTVTAKATAAPSTMMITPAAINLQAAAAPSITLEVRDEALADFINLKVDGQATRASRVVMRRGKMVV